MFVALGFERMLAVLAGILLLPVGLTLWVRRAALRAAGDDRAAAWFGFARFLRGIVVGTMVLWWATTDLVGTRLYADAFFKALGLTNLPGSKVLTLLLFWLPPMLAVIFCQVLSRPVHAGVRGIEWSRTELASVAALGLGMSVVPLLIVVAGFEYLFGADDLGGLLLCYAIAAAVWIFSARRLLAQLQMTPHALTAGELRDRSFALAWNLGVKLRQIYVLPAGKGRMANAFARSGNSILLTDYLLTYLNKREVDAIVAHELAHLKHDHPRKLGFVMMGGLAVVIAAWYSLPGATSVRPLFDVLFVVVPLWSKHFVSRRFEFTADASAAKLTGDPEASITSLVKLHRLNLMPIQWGKWIARFMTHPTTVRRAEAIARQTRIPAERVAQILEVSLAPAAPPSGNAAEYYSLPSSVTGASKIFSTDFKQRIQLRAYLASLAATTILPAVFVWGILAAAWPVAGWLVCLIAFALTAASSLLLQNFLPFLSQTRLKKQLCGRFEREGIRYEEWRGSLVGFSPDALPRIYDTNYSWDMGYVVLSGDRLCYWGEETRFALRREQVVSVRLAPGIPGWLRVPNLYLTWRDDTRHTDVTFNMRPMDVHSFLEMKSKVRALGRRVEAWRAGASTAEVPPAPLAELTTPSIGQVTSASLRESRKPGSVVALLLIVGLVTGYVSSMVGLHVDIATPIAHALGPVSREQSGTSGWYAVFAAWLVLLFNLAPLWFYREPSLSGRTVANPQTVPKFE